MIAHALLVVNDVTDINDASYDVVVDLKALGRFTVGLTEDGDIVLREHSDTAEVPRGALAVLAKTVRERKASGEWPGKVTYASC